MENNNIENILNKDVKEVARDVAAKTKEIANADVSEVAKNVVDTGIKIANADVGEIASKSIKTIKKGISYLHDPMIDAVRQLNEMRGKTNPDIKYVKADNFLEVVRNNYYI